MIYLNVEDLGWRPFITSWMALKKEQVGDDPSSNPPVAQYI